MKILVTPTSFLTPPNAPAKAALENFASEVVYNDLTRPLHAEEVIERLAGVDGYIAGLDHITDEVIRAAPETLKVISRYGIGVDRVDLQACQKRGIVVTNTPGTNSIAVCELAFALMLCAARNIPRLHNAVENGQWPRSEGVELHGKVLGIIGLGAIGKHLAIRAKAFGMKIVAYDSCLDETFVRFHDFRALELDALLEQSDFISLHVPQDSTTTRIIDAKTIQRMKTGVILINTARGGLLDEEAVAEGIRSGKLGGVGLDAFEEEPLLNSPLKGLDRVIFTPHSGAHTLEAVRSMGHLAVENLITVLKGETSPCCVSCDSDS